LGHQQQTTWKIELNIKMVAEEDVAQTLLLHAVNRNKVVTFNVKIGGAVTGMENKNF
jgi:hypothetical protein